MSVDLSIQHAMRMRHIVTCGLSGCTVFFSTLFHKRHVLRKEVLGQKVRVMISSPTFAQNFLILGRTGRDMIIYIYSYSCKVPVITVRF